MTSDIANWSADTRTLVTAVSGSAAIVLLIVSFVIGDAVGQGQRQTASRLNSSAWSMSTQAILQGWEPRQVKLARVAYVITALLYVAVGIVGLVVSSVLAHTESAHEWVGSFGKAAAVVSIVIAVVGIVEQLCLIVIIGRYARSQSVWWLGASVALTLMIGRFLGLALVTMYVLTASASL